MITASTQDPKAHIQDLKKQLEDQKNSINRESFELEGSFLALLELLSVFYFLYTSSLTFKMYSPSLLSIPRAMNN